MPNVTITLDPQTLKEARNKAKDERRSLSAQVAVWISEATNKASRIDQAQPVKRTSHKSR